MTLLAFLLRSSRQLFVLSAVSGILGGACVSGIVAVIHHSLGGSLTTHYRLLLGAFVILWVGYGLFSVGSTYFLTRLTEQAIFDLRVGISRQILEAPYPLIERERDRLLAVLTTDIDTIAYAVERLPTVFVGSATVTGLLIFLLWVAPVFLALVLGVILLGVWIYCLPLKRFRAHADAIRQGWHALIQHFQALIFGAKELHQHRQRRQDFLREAIEGASTLQMKETVRGRTLEAIMTRWGELYLLLGLGVLLFTVPFLPGVSLEKLGQFVLVSLFLLSPLSTITGFFTEMERVKIAFRHIRKAGVDLQEEIRRRPGSELTPSAIPDRSPETITFSEITYAYSNRDSRHGETPFTLGPLDLSINRGEILFLTGGNGSGKTTLAKIICGLYPPDSGGVLVDQEPLDLPGQVCHREWFSAIFPDFYLFPILHGIDDSALERRAGETLRAMNLDTTVSLQGRRFSTVDLSSGQRKRMALVVALLEDRPFVLLDEWAAEQDIAFKKSFYKELVPALKKAGKGVVVISHDDRFFHLADRILKLEEGRLAVGGTGSAA